MTVKISRENPAVVVVAHKGYRVRASYTVGPYIELSFAREYGAFHQAIEVINVYDYAKGEVDPRVATVEGVSEIVEEWVKMATDPEDGDPDAFRRYYENS